MTIIGGIEGLEGLTGVERAERRLEDERLSHVRLWIDGWVWERDDGALVSAVARLARKAELVLACRMDPRELMARPERLLRWSQRLAEAGGVLELPAEPPPRSIWSGPEAAPGAIAALEAAAGLVHEAGCAIAWGVTLGCDLEALVRRGPLRVDEPIVLDGSGCDGEALGEAIRRVAACRPQAPRWVCVGDPPSPTASTTARARAGAGTSTELERFVEATERGVERVYWSGRPDAPLRALWRRLGERRASSLLVRPPAPRDARPRLAGSGSPRVLVTGGAGFVGCNLVARLRAEGRHVVILDDLSRPGVERNLEWLQGLRGGSLELVAGDVRSPAALERALPGVDQVFHLAAQVAVTTSLEDPVRDFEINAGGTLRLLEALRRRPSPPSLVLTSTNKVYGDLQDVLLEEHDRRYAPVSDALRASGIGETRPLDLHSPYGCSKGAADQYALDHARCFGVPTVVLRMSCIYGPHQLGTEDQGWVAHLMRQAMEGEPITIFGDGKQVRDVLFVDDLVDVLCRVGARSRQLRGQAFNVGGGPERTLSLLELVDELEHLLGRRPSVRFGPWRRGDQRYYVADTRRLERALEWRPRVGVEEGLRRLHQWLEEAGAAGDRPEEPAAEAPGATGRAASVSAPEAVSAHPGSGAVARIEPCAS